MSEGKIVIYTDGASRGNPGPGGYGVVLYFNGNLKELSGGFRKTTNNRMELMAVIAALEALKKEGFPVVVFSDSKYVVDAIAKGWLWSWVKKGFKNKKNPDLWRRLIPLLKKYKPQFRWVKGHADIPYNERCDRLAVEAAQEPDLPADAGYETQEANLL